MTIYNQHVIDRIVWEGSLMLNKFIQGKCSGFAFGIKLNKYNKLKHAEYDLIASFTGNMGADYEPMFNGLGRDA